MNIVYLQSTKVVYSRRVGAYGIENKSLMDSFKNWLKSENLFQKSIVLGIPLDDPKVIPENKCRYDVCLITNKNSFKANIKQRILKDGSYAVFKINHTEKSINEFYTNVFQIIRKYKLHTLNQPIIERYQQNMVDNGYCEILIPVK